MKSEKLEPTNSIATGRQKTFKHYFLKKLQLKLMYGPCAKNTYVEFKHRKSHAT